MRTPLRLIPLALAALLLAALAGCSDSDNDPTAGEPVAVDDYAGLDLDEPYGGLTKTDEEPAFGDPYLEQEAAIADGETYEDDLLTDPEVRRYMRIGEEPGQPGDPQRPTFTFLRLVWGNLEAMPDSVTGRIEDGDGIDWSGQLSVDRGTVLVRRVILFERPWDSLVRPRVDRHTVSWFSAIGGHVDGLLIQIIEPPVDADGDGEVDPGMDEPNMLHFVTDQFTQSFEVAALPELDEIYPAATEGQAIQFAGFTLGDLDPCPKGYLAGVWHATPEHEDGGGVFRGRWVGLYGMTEGFLRGRYGVDDSGERVFFGKYVSRSGQFRGLIAGTWEPADEAGRGTFAGHWIGNSEEVEGVLGGRYLDLPERPGGFMQGRWATTCDDEAVAQIQE
jgi:hypothetical protein